MAAQDAGERWDQKWRKERDPEWHKDRVHPFLLKYEEELLKGRDHVTVFLPLCGKVKDLAWLAAKGYHVIGIEISSSAIEFFFEEQSISFVKENVKLGQDVCACYRNNSGTLRIYCANVLEYLRNTDNTFDLIWDAQSLVAFPNESSRKEYVDAIIESKVLKKDGIYLLESYDYDTNQYNYGPKYVSEEEINTLYKCGEVFTIERLEFQPNYCLKPFYDGGVTLRLHKLTQI